MVPARKKWLCGEAGKSRSSLRRGGGEGTEKCLVEQGRACVCAGTEGNLQAGSQGCREAGRGQGQRDPWGCCATSWASGEELPPCCGVWPSPGVGPGAARGGGAESRRPTQPRSCGARGGGGCSGLTAWGRAGRRCCGGISASRGHRGPRSSWSVRPASAVGVRVALTEARLRRRSPFPDARPAPLLFHPRFSPSSLSSCCCCCCSVGFKMLI